MPRTTFTVAQPWSRGSRAQSDQGVSLDALVTAAAPTLPNAKNASLRVTVTVSSGRAGSVTFALGELQSVLATVPVDVTVPLTSDGLLVGCGWGLDCCDAAVVAEARPEGRAGAAIAACAPSATPATSALFAVD